MKHINQMAEKLNLVMERQLMCGRCVSSFILKLTTIGLLINERAGLMS